MQETAHRPDGELPHPCGTALAMSRWIWSRTMSEATLFFRNDSALMETQSPKDPRAGQAVSTGWSVRRHLAVSFSVLATLGTILCGVLVLLVWRVNGSLDEVEENAAATQQALALSLSVREQYIHETHTILEGNATHVHHHDAWVARATEQARDLEARLPAAEAQRAHRVALMSAELDTLFTERIVPAAVRSDAEEIRRAHREAERLAGRSQTESARLVEALEDRVAAIHAETLSVSRIGVGLAASGTVALAFIAVLLFGRLRRSLLDPLRALAAEAQRVARGETTRSVAGPAAKEVATVITSFEGMSEELAERDQWLVRVERMAALGELGQAVGDAIQEPCTVMHERATELREAARFAPMREELGIILEEVAACDRIVDDLHAWAAKPHIEWVEVQVAELAQSAIDRFRATEPGLRVQVEASIEPATVELDPLRIRQVLSNLLRNAAQASPEGGVVTVEGTRNGDEYQIVIRDRGAGIPPEALERIFEPFYSLRAGGSGLGLAVCHGLVSAHGGRIGARLPEENGGVELVVDLPVCCPT